MELRMQRRGVVPADEWSHMSCAAQTPRRPRAAFVYVAASDQLDLVTVGFASDPNDQIMEINRAGCAGASDWWLYSARQCEMACSIVELARARLRQERLAATNQDVFSCGAAVADEAVLSVMLERQRLTGA